MNFMKRKDLHNWCASCLTEIARDKEYCEVCTEQIKTEEAWEKAEEYEEQLDSPHGTMKLTPNG
jgi:predicted amidophosphoribosyltransferase